MEAARSLGMTGGQAMRYVILPQAIKLVVPPLTNEFIAMIKDTSLMSVITVPELLFTAKEKMGVVANPTPLTVAALIYVIFTIPLIRLAARLETRRRKPRPPDRPSGASDISAEAEQDIRSADVAGQMP
jgi:polar amino acid transport system permease protein